MYRNSEGYPDPTAGAALANVAREERRKKAAGRRPRRRFMPKVYICSPFAGDVETNVRNARRYCAFAVSRGYNPLRQPPVLSAVSQGQRSRATGTGALHGAGVSGQMP